VAGASAVAVTVASSNYPAFAPALALLPSITGAMTKVVQWINGRHTQDLLAAHEEARNDYLLNFAHELRAVIERLKAHEPRIETLEEDLRARTEDPQFHRLLDNFTLEATRSPMNERIRMLACAGANAFNVTMTLAQAARAERALRELDPVDVEILRVISRSGDSTGYPFPGEAPDPLVSAGCLRSNFGLARSIVMYWPTAVGRLVLRLLDSYAVGSTQHAAAAEQLAVAANLAAEASRAAANLDAEANRAAESERAARAKIEARMVPRVLTPAQRV
jgi:hypothetical protein